MRLDLAVSPAFTPTALSPVGTPAVTPRATPPVVSESADSRVAAFARDGFLGPVRLFTPGECRRIAGYLHWGDQPTPPDWEKGRAVRERFIFELATRPALISAVSAVLGEDVVLWGASSVLRAPGVSHPWHTDIESGAPEGGFVTAWVGVEHTTRESAPQLITRTHRLGLTVQEARLEQGLQRDQATAEVLLDAARERDPAAALVQPDMTNGDGILFDGRLWHGSFNGRKRGRRLALLLQYARATSVVRIPDFGQLDWPFRFRAAPRPAVIVVLGSAPREPNRVVPPPAPPTNPSPGCQMVTTAIHPIVLPVDNPAKDWQTFPAFHGPTATLVDMSCHASVLVPGHAPHPPHAHEEEELLIPLGGAVELVIAAEEHDQSPRLERLEPGSIVYYPVGQYHTIHSVGPSAAAYLMFKWRARATAHAAGDRVLETTVWRDIDDAVDDGSTPVRMRRLFEGPTTYLAKLHAHVTTLQPGAGYAPHVDAYDVAILTLSGSVETLGERVEPNSVVYYAAGELHGMRNVGNRVARYLVFEFHAPGLPAIAGKPHYRRQAARAIRVGKRLARAVWRRVRGN